MVEIFDLAAANLLSSVILSFVPGIFAALGRSDLSVPEVAVRALQSISVSTVAFEMLKIMTNLSRIDAAAVTSHYGTIAVVTFVSATSVLNGRGISSKGYMVTVAAVM
ncbi:hypothetical protein OAN307_c04740 [Octadecabacter antarcticus 307]|uniref:Uncharacterized protein n=1 Tax=Octadecabacter antarcticus 307 TaxID=391626 RepID=M9R1U4_9RHOB|nr:sodium-dependent bicarbonate transport family permease [Octadecabacter antarcticus]AGI66212.1 hypothetical protein OAN307_c04740 [Octadecabacter antarcticus 307]